MWRDGRRAPALGAGPLALALLAAARLAAARPAGAQLPAAGFGPGVTVAAAAGADARAERDDAYSPRRYGGAGAAFEGALVRRTAGLAVALRLGAATPTTLRPADGGGSFRRDVAGAGAQLAALVPAGRVLGARVLAGGAVDLAGAGALPRQVGADPVTANERVSTTWVLSLRPVVQAEGRRGRLALAYEASAAAAGWVWRPYPPAATAERARFAGPGGLRAVEQALAAAYPANGRLAVAGAYRLALAGLRDAPARRAAAHRVTVGLAWRRGAR